MKITRIGSSFPLLTASTLGGGGGTISPAVGSDLVPVSNGSNGWAWGSNVSRISAGGSNVTGPYVNFAAGSNVTLTIDGAVASNTIRIHATSGAASFGSNSNAVSSANAPGASTDSSRADHVHLGVTSLAHSSNTFSGPVILTASGVLGITSPTPGTYNLSATGGSGGGGSTITTKDEGSTLSTAVTTLDFVGAGVTASGAGATTTVTIAGGGAFTALSDTFNRADGAVGNADGGPLQVWQASSGTWEIFTNRLRETGAGAERFIFTYAGYQRGLRTFVWTMNTKPTTGDGGLVFRAPYGGSTVPPLLLLNVEATYKLYSLGGGGVYTAITVSSGTPVAPVNGDVITVVDDGIQVKVSVNGGAQVVYVNTTLQGGPFVGFRNSSGGGMTHDSIVITDT